MSNTGKVRRNAGQGTKGGNIKPYLDSRKRYLRVSLHKGGVRTIKTLHRLVAEAFISNPKNLPEVNHIFNIKTNCKVSNLEWRSRLGNMRHATVSGLKGEGVTKVHNKWRARYYPNPGVRVHLGMFATKKEAVRARQVALKTLQEII